jgi:hypothetical protein
LSALTSQPFESVQDIAWLTCRSCSTVDLHLPRSLGFRLPHLRWISHVSTDKQKLNRVRDSQALLRMLQVQYLNTEDGDWSPMLYFSSFSLLVYQDRPCFLPCLDDFSVLDACPGQ